jgi:ribosomal protein S18 acetylase RimI-like enzyme
MLACLPDRSGQRGAAMQRPDMAADRRCAPDGDEFLCHCDEPSMCRGQNEIHLWKIIEKRLTKLGCRTKRATAAAMRRRRERKSFSARNDIAFGSVMTLRQAGSADLEKIEAFQRKAYAANRAILGVEPLPLLALYAEILRDHEIWLAESCGEVQGILILAIRDDDLVIWSVAVEPALQGRGIGSELLDFAERRALEAKLSNVRLYTAAQLSENIAWYQRRSFAIERHERLPDRTLVHMVKTLA